MHFAKQILSLTFSSLQVLFKETEPELMRLDPLPHISVMGFPQTRQIMVLDLLLCWSFGCAAALEPTCLSAQFRRPGDYILGGLFPLGRDILNLTARSEPTLVVCER